ncbi:NDP-hexose 2,3-dehydratase family protein [Amycolatopsis plumensis]|uniref:NDP-hexose 2,3-dehydratase family protein n=1 Tax=Amycolatopsis plumensis TaxID=236508 RepID=UPI0036242A20
MVVEVADHVEVGHDFCWLTLGQINELLARDYVVNMDSRTVLSCLPASSVPAWSRDATLPGAHRSTHALLRWLTERQVDSELDAQRVRLTDLPSGTVPTGKSREVTAVLQCRGGVGSRG